MRERTVKQIKVISCHDPTEFQELFNEAQRELASKHPVVEFNMAMGHCAYITYDEKICVPENAEDEFYQMGLSYKCRNCPKFNWPMTQTGSINRIKKEGDCMLKASTRRDNPACEYLYKSILTGDLKPIDDDELEDFQRR